MILKASERGNSAWLGRHLLNVGHNEHVEIHDIRGFIAEDVMGAMKEAQAMSYGTRCKNYLFSLSMNPPENEIVRPEVFERAAATVEERLNLTGHARIMVFHEKESRRHCHVVWSRIDPETMTAKNLPHFKNKLCEVSREQYLEHGWKMPPGLAHTKDRDPRNFTLDEWQQAKRAGLNARDAKASIQDSWAISDNAQSFTKAMEERGFFVSRGDRRGYVAVSYEGQVFAIPKMIGIHTSQVMARLGDPEKLRSLADTYRHIGETIKPRVSEHIRAAKAKAAADMSPLEQQRQAMKPSMNRSASASMPV